MLSPPTINQILLTKSIEIYQKPHYSLNRGHPHNTLILLGKSIDIKNLLFVRIRFLVTIVPRNDKNKRNILGMIKTRKISSERQKQEKHYWNDKNFVILSVSEGSFVANAPSE